MKSSTRDKVEGAVREATGKLKEKFGKAMSDPRMRARGTAEKVGGKSKGRRETSRDSLVNSFFESCMYSVQFNAGTAS
jgi:uncharacterized protein YjbJ (UPF0337 family)